MPDSLEPFPAGLVNLAQPEALRANFSAERSRIVARIRARIEEARSDLEKERRNFEELLGQLVALRAGSEELRRLSQEAVKNTRSRSEEVHAGVEALQQHIARHQELQKPDVLQCFNAGIEIALSRLDLLAAFGRKLEVLAEQHNARRPFTIPAQRMNEIDHQAITREIIARFPQILAALAK